MSRQISNAELASHNTPEDCWIAVDGRVYDVTKFLPQHPGGAKIITDLAGKECTEQFFALHRGGILDKFGPKLQVGVLQGAQVDFINRPYREISEVLFGDNTAFQLYNSPYYKESHLRFHKAIRALLHKHVVPNGEALDNAGRLPKDKIWKALGAAGFHAVNLPPNKYIGKYAEALGGVGADEFDYFHEMIHHVEMHKLALPGYVDGLTAGHMIGLPPVMHFRCASEAVTEKCIKDCIVGDKRICLAISEPWAGSDVANVNCTAVKSDCGQYYVVNGLKKWITGGMASHYFTTAVRTGPKKLSFLLIERSMGGVETKKIKTRYSPSAGTALVIFENVKVPVTHLLGTEGDGFKMIMHNFNHERWGLACNCLGMCRRAIEEVTKWLLQRKAFGKPLMKQPALRQKLASMITKTESLQAYMDNITHQMNTMPFKEQNKKLGGPICLLKLHAARVSEEVCNEAVQLFGGRGLTNHGMGQYVQRLRAFNQYNGIYGGSNEVLGDYAVRQVARMVPKWSRL